MAFNNYVDRILPFSDPPPCVDSFYTLSVDKTDIFLPPHLVHVVIEWPLTDFKKNMHILFPVSPTSYLPHLVNVLKERPLARKGVQNHLSNKCKQIINSPMGGSSSLQYTIHTYRVDMVVTIHDDLLTQWRHIPKGQFRANVFY